jgi:polyhydroxyalkanoate depolymerase
MQYYAYQLQTDMLQPVRAAALVGQQWFGGMAKARPHAASTPLLRRMAAGFEMVGRARLTHTRPAFGITEVVVGGELVPVEESVETATPFASLVRFRRASDVELPRVLILAPLSGHFATLLRSTVRTMLQDHEVYITDWHNVRDVPVADGPFGFEDYTDHVMRFLEHLGPGAHLFAVCQPCVSALAATALLAEAGSPATPRSLTLMAGPIDTRESPTSVDDLASMYPIEWFRDNLITRVPWQFAGAGRRVYPGFAQVTAFVSMNPRTHLEAHWRMFENLADGRTADANWAKAFYDEYFAVLDLAAEFYLDTVDQVFQQHTLPRRVMTHRGHRIDTAAIRETALLTIEGERDDICAPGQTAVAHDLTPSIPDALRARHLQPGAGHYGVFSGHRWETEVYPLVRATILANDHDRRAATLGA